MTLADFQPTNDLENAIRDASLGYYPIEALLDLMTRSPLCVSSLSEVQQDGSGFTPMLFQKDGQPLVAVFSSVGRPGLHKSEPHYVIQMEGKHILSRIPFGYGVILNPGFLNQLIVNADRLAQLNEKLKADVGKQETDKNLVCHDEVKTVNKS